MTPRTTLHSILPLHGISIFRKEVREVVLLPSFGVQAVRLTQSERERWNTVSPSWAECNLDRKATTRRRRNSTGWSNGTVRTSDSGRTIERCIDPTRACLHLHPP